MTEHFALPATSHRILGAVFIFIYLFIGGWADGRMGEWADGRMGGWADGRMGGCRCKTEAARKNMFLLLAAVAEGEVIEVVVLSLEEE